MITSLRWTKLKLLKYVLHVVIAHLARTLIRHKRTTLDEDVPLWFHQGHIHKTKDRKIIRHTGDYCGCTVLDWCVVCTGLVCCMYWTGVLYVLDWCVVCTGLVCCMYWTGALYVLDWCVVCTGLVCCMYWTGVLYVLDWCVVCTGLVCCVCTGLVCCMSASLLTECCHRANTTTS